MKNLIEILPNVYGVKVPSDATELELICLESMYLRLKTNSEYRNIKLGFGTLENIKLLGTLTKDEISFDASEVVESTEIDVEQYDGILVATPRFWDYELESFSCSSSDESFRSALSEEIYFENPFGENPDLHNQYVKGKMIICDESDRKFVKDCEQYQTAQENITQKLLILQRL